LRQPGSSPVEHALQRFEMQQGLLGLARDLIGGVLGQCLVDIVQGPAVCIASTCTIAARSR